MPQYSYKAKNLQGDEIAGSLEALNEKQLARNLRGQGYFLISASGPSDQENNDKKKEGKLEHKFKATFLDIFLNVSLTEKLFFTRNLEVMIKSGVSLVKSFEILAQQARSKKFKQVLRDISERINKGESLSQAIGSYPKIFSLLFQETIRVGEETGRLSEALQTLYKQMEKEHSLKSKIKSAMIYPIMVLVVAFGIGIFLMIFAVPKIQASFVEMGIQLPLTTKIILGVAGFLSKNWIIFLLSLFIFIFLFSIFARSGKGGKLKSTLWLHLPIISKLTRQTNSALTLRTLSSLLQAGVPIVRSLIIASGSLTNFYFRKALEDSAQRVEKGEKLSKSLTSHQDILSPMVVQMIEVGEETGETPNVLEKLADFLEEEAGASTERLSAIMEPLLIMCVGGAVGFFAVSMMQPMFSIMEGVK
ncbi:MAG: type II secretion system F family protein [Candidatus Pacebacteria bacterium]|nr:type II secretion system F family protein [Candidatus Paceibacterota bacterium]